MNKNKISSKLIDEVNVLTLQDEPVFVSSNNFNETKNFLNKFNYQYVPYRFANCFCLKADFEDINILSNQTSVRYIFPNEDVKISRTETDLMNLPHLTQNKYLGQGQTICFIDTGVYPHVDFILPTNRIVKFIDLVNFAPNAYDDNGHGTFVAGIACGRGLMNKNSIGFAPLANIISIKALSDKGSSNSNVILDAMQWVYENHKAYNIGVVCMSFGADTGLDSDPLSSGAEALWRRGITVVAAAGNSGPENESIKSPGNNPHIITVGGLDVNTMQTADFSSRGPTIYGHKPDLLAPAVNISSCNNNLPFYTTMSGTSVATPIVAGICADIKSRWKNVTNNEIKKFLVSHCTHLTGEVDVEGAGYLNFNNLYS